MEDSHDYFVTLITDINCQHCREEFPSRNKLHRHLRGGCLQGAILLKKLTGNAFLIKAPVEIPHTSVKVVTLSANPATDTETGYNFRNWHYIMAEVKLAPDMPLEAVCLNTECSVTLID